MIYQAIIEGDSDLDVLAVDGDGNYVIGNDVVGELAFLESEWSNVSCPDGGKMMPGTRVNNSKKVVHVLMHTDTQDPLGLLTLLFASYDLDWNILLLATLYALPDLDEEGNPIPIPDTDPVEYEPDSIVYLMDTDAGLLDYMADVVTDATDPENPVMGRPTPPIQLHRYHDVGLVLE